MPKKSGRSKERQLKEHAHGHELVHLRIEVVLALDPGEDKRSVGHGLAQELLDYPGVIDARLAEDREETE